VPRFSDGIRALNERIRSNGRKLKEEEAFQKVKDAYHDNQVLVLHNPRSKHGFIDYAIGAEITKMGNDKFCPIQENDCPEMNYSTPDKELQ
jgi:hypothetical protein